MSKDDLLEELDVLKTYFEECIDASATEQSLEETYLFAQMKGYVEHTIKFIKEVAK